MFRRVQHPLRRTATGLLTLVVGVTLSALVVPAADASSHRRATYVALGDSYAAGEGLAPYEEGDGSCDRSANDSYPELLADSHLQAFRRLTSVACSGAITTSLFVAAGDGPPAQLTAVTPRTKTVTVTIGGNDAGFIGAVAECLYAPGATPQVKAALTQAGLDGGPGCRDRLNGIVTARILNLAQPTGRPELGSRSLPEVIAAIQARSPRAQIYVSGYPQLLGTAYVEPYGCPVGTFGPAPLAITSDDARWIREKAAELNAAIAASVAQARYADRRVHFVDVSRRFDGHNVCDTGKPWINSLTIGAAGVDPASLHPTARGQRSYARAFERAARR